MRFENGFGMKVAIIPCLCATSLAAIFTKVKLSRGLERIRIGEVDFELAVAVFVIDLIHIDAHRPQTAHHLVESLARAIQALVVVARFVQIVGGVGGPQAAVGAARQEHELRFDAGEQGQAAFRETRDLILQRDP